MAELSFEGVSHAFGSGEEVVEALGDIHLTIPSGQIGSIVGSSGCGKTTLLRIACGLIAPSEGTVHIDDEPISGIPDRVGLIFQDYDNTLLKWKSVYDNVLIGAEMSGLEGDEAREVADNYIELVGLEDFQKNYIQELSGGMKQRVQVARVFSYSPDILLCDEPFGALDAQTKEKLQEEFLKILNEENVTTMFVTHDIEEAIYMGDTLYAFTDKNPGRINDGIDTAWEGPLFPKTAFEQNHTNRIADLKQEVQGIIKE